MSGQRDRPLVLAATAGMELCRLSVLGALFAHMAPSLVFPFFSMALSLLAALALARLLKRIKHRRVTGLAVHALGYLAATESMLRSTVRPPSAQAGGFLVMMGADGRLAGVADWAAFLLIVLFALLFWIRGERIGTTEPSYRITAARFDIGVGVFFGVYLLRMGIGLADPHAVPLVVAYFLFAMVALYAARNVSYHRAFVVHRSALTLLVPFVGSFLLLGGAGVLFFPYLTQAAGQVYGTLRDGVAPLSPWLAAILRFLFGFGFRRAHGVDATGAGGGTAGVPLEELSRQAGLLERILAWSAGAIIIALALALIAIVVWRIFRYLVATADGDDTRLGIWGLLRRLMLRLFGMLRRLGRLLTRFGRRRLQQSPVHSGEAAAAFFLLSAWGRRSGVPRRCAETGRAYGRRLATRFPAAAAAAETIVTMAELEVYALRPMGASGRRRLRRARALLASPRLYPRRLASRLGLSRAASSAIGVAQQGQD